MSFSEESVLVGAGAGAKKGISLKAFSEVNMNTAPLWNGETTIANSNQIQVSYNSYYYNTQLYNYYGNFSYDSYGLIKNGTVTSINYFNYNESNSKIYEITGASYNVLTFMNAIHDAVYSYNNSINNSASSEGRLNLYRYIFSGNDTINGSNFDDYLIGSLGNDKIYGNNGNDILYGGNYYDNNVFDGNDILFGGNGNDTLEGKNGNDILYGDSGNDALSVSLSSSNNTLYGGTGNDDIRGGIGNNILYGESCNDTLSSSNGNNTLYGGDGDDNIRVGIGNNILLGGDGNDNLSIFSYFDEDFTSNAKITLSGGNGNDNFSADLLVYSSNIEINLNLKVTFKGDSGNDTISLGMALGNNNLYGYGGAGNDYLRGGDGNEVIFGDGNNDTLSGNSGNDSLYGGNGKDIVSGDDGKDILSGGDGSDIFMYSRYSYKDESGITGTTRDIITDFNHNEKDKISFHDDNNLAPKLEFIGSLKFSSAGQIRFDSITHILYISNADLTSDFSITLNGVNSLQTSDFIL